eukprot:Gb_33953 [translate_table: standard]
MALVAASEEISASSTLPLEFDNGELISRAWKIIFSMMPPMILQSAVRLKVPDIISRAGPGAALSAQDIAAQLTAATQSPCNIDILSRILAYLSSIGIFAQKIIDHVDDTASGRTAGTREIRYALTDMTKAYFVTENNPTSLVPFLLQQTYPTTTAAWNNIAECTLSQDGSSAFEICYGQDVWSYAQSHADTNDIFNASMASLTKAVMSDVLAAYDGFKDVNTLVDVAGGVGQALIEIVSAYPHIHAINFDQPHVIANAPAVEGIQHVSGNIFEGIPSGDAFFMKHVLHLWDDKECHDILLNCYNALSANGKLILAEAVIKVCEDELDPVGCGQAMDMIMLGFMHGGRERTEQQWKDLLGDAGFRITKIVGRKQSLVKVIEAVKLI